MLRLWSFICVLVACYYVEGCHSLKGSIPMFGFASSFQSNDSFPGIDLSLAYQHSPCVPTQPTPPARRSSGGLSALLDAHTPPSSRIARADLRKLSAAPLRIGSLSGQVEISDS